MEKKFHRSHRAATLKKRKRKSSLRRKKRSIQKRSIQKRSIQKRSIQKRKQKTSHRKLRSLPILRGGARQNQGKIKSWEDLQNKWGPLEISINDLIKVKERRQLPKAQGEIIRRIETFNKKLGGAIKGEIIEYMNKMIQLLGGESKLSPTIINENKIEEIKDLIDEINGVIKNNMAAAAEAAAERERQAQAKAVQAQKEQEEKRLAQEAAARQQEEEKRQREAVNEIIKLKELMINLEKKANEKIKEADKLSKQLSGSLVNKGKEEAEKEEEGEKALQKATGELGYVVDYHLNEIEKFIEDPKNYNNISGIPDIATKGKEKLEGVVNKANEAIDHFNRVKIMINEREAEAEAARVAAAAEAARVAAAEKKRQEAEAARVAAEAEAARVAEAEAARVAAEEAEAEAARVAAAAEAARVAAAEKKRQEAEAARVAAEAEAARVAAAEEEAAAAAQAQAQKQAERERQIIKNKLRNNCNESKFELINNGPIKTYTRFDDFNKLDSQDEPENKYIYFIEETIDDKTEINKYFDEYIKLIYRYKNFQKENKEFNNDIFVHVKISDDELFKNHKDLFNHIKSLNLKDIESLGRQEEKDDSNLVNDIESLLEDTKKESQPGERDGDVVSIGLKSKYKRTLDKLQRIGNTINENELSELNRFKKIVEDPFDPDNPETLHSDGSNLYWNDVDMNKLEEDFKKLKKLIVDGSSPQV